jgi:HTH-type transcriptional regulator / antitoxin MqsA
VDRLDGGAEIFALTRTNRSAVLAKGGGWLYFYSPFIAGAFCSNEVKMSQCHVCQATEFREEKVDEIFWIDGRPILVEGIPATICLRCGEVSFSRETTEKIRRMLHGEAKPVKEINMKVFAFK